MLSSSHSVFDDLPTRPPTPPREISEAFEDAIDFLSTGNESEILAIEGTASGHAVSQTTPSSSQERSASGTGSRRVDFSPNPRFHKITPAGQHSSPNSSILKRSPSAKGAKPRKSILKQSNAPPPTPEDLDNKLSYFSPDVPGSFTKMLQSVLQQLAGPSRSSRLDAYLTLTNTFRVYENPPDLTAMVAKMPVLMQFLTRDMAWKGMDGKLDAQIISQALNVVFAIQTIRLLSDALDDDFRTFLVDRSISVLEQKDMPKQIVKQHIALMASQRFRPSIMTTSRVEKLVTALQSIEDRCSGNSVVATRLVVYGRLVEQSSAVMLSRTADWLQHVFHGVLSSISDIRSRAIDALAKAGMYLGAQATAAKAIENIFESDSEEGETYWTYFNMRLIEMVNDVDAKAYVPQIWSAIILWFRSKRRPLDKWPKFKAWLRIIQTCFNSSDIKTRYQTLQAWNKFVFIITSAESMSEATLRTLRLPLASGVGKKGSDYFARQIRGYSLESYHLLLHYILRPGLTFNEYDTAWEIAVPPVVTEIAKASVTGKYDVCRILQGLLSPNDGAWNVNAALESAAIRSDELPQLDPRWVRSRLGRILSIFEPILSLALKSSDASFVRVEDVWKLLMQSIAQAGTQEVRITSDLKEAIAFLVNMFCRTWRGCDLSHQGATDAATWTDRYSSLIDIMLAEIGTGFFLEEILTKTGSDSVEVAPTPSHRSSKNHTTPISPMIILFDQFYHPPTPLQVCESYLCNAKTLLSRLLAAKSSPSARLELLNRSLHAWLPDVGVSAADSLVNAMWTVIAEVAMHNLSAGANTSTEEESQDLGLKLRGGFEVLIQGLRTCRDTGSGRQSLDRLYTTLHQTAKTRAGDAGVVMAIMEPLAKATMEGRVGESLDMKIAVADLLLRNPVWPKSSQAMDQARKALWGVGPAPHKSAPFDPFDSTYALLRSVWVDCYNAFDGSSGLAPVAFEQLSSRTLQFLRIAPVSLLGLALRKLQQSFVIWVEDKDRRTHNDQQITRIVLSTWFAVIQLLRSMPSKDNTVLKAFEPLLIAGFSSPHRDVVNSTIVFWNEEFGQQTSLEYPTKLASVLSARSEDANIDLPTFPTISDGPASLPQFYDSQSHIVSGQDMFQSAMKSFPAIAETAKSPRLGLPSRFDFSKSSPLRRANDIASPARRIQRNSASTTPRARLRHNDSQIEFAPIDSSPIRQDEESQMLTEHQKDVKTRQLDNAQLFPDFPSSPVAQSTALPRNVSKRLDFSSEAHRLDDRAHGTPTGLPDATTLPSDDIPSSPTPSSTRAASQGPVNVDDDLDQDNHFHDPPSSPPHTNDDEHKQPAQIPDDANDTTIEVTDFASRATPLLPTVTEDEIEVEDVGTDEEAAEIVLGSDLPSDTDLPNTQLLEEGAEAAQLSNLDNRKIEDERSHDTIQQSHVGAAEVDNINVERTIESEVQEVADISRVEDSFVQADQKHDSQDTEKSPSPMSPNTGKKRKRPSGHASKSNKRKKQSPFKSIWSTLISGTQDDDEDIGEEIVVASQKSSLSDVSRVEQTILAPEEASMEASQEPVGPPEEEPATMQPPPKRGRGRPRRSQTPTPSISNVQVSQSLKRKASVLSDASQGSDQVATSFVKDTPAPTEAAKQRKDHNTRRTRASQEAAKSETTTTRQATAVVIRNNGDVLGRQSQANAETKDMLSEEESTGQATPERQLAEEQAAADLSDRRILTPRSIIGRLWETVRDIKTLALGPQLEREFDDVLFELRRETHDAARRGRQL